MEKYLMSLFEKLLWYFLGKMRGASTVILEAGEDYTFTDANNDGHIVITKVGD